MQEKNKKISTFFKKIKKIQFSFGSDGDMDWVIIFFTSIVLFFIASAWGGYIYFFAKTQNTADVSEAPASSELINEKEFQDILTRYQEKKVKFGEFSSQKPAMPDPAR